MTRLLRIRIDYTIECDFRAEAVEVPLELLLLDNHSATRWQWNCEIRSSMITCTLDVS
jgi:hypothetical protein